MRWMSAAISAYSGERNTARGGLALDVRGGEAEQALGGAVDRRDAPARVERDHAGGHRLEDGLGVAAALLDLGVLALEVAVRLLELGLRGVEVAASSG